MNQLFSIAEVAEYLKLDKQTVFKWVKTGKLKAVQLGKVWRISKESIEELLKPIPESEEKVDEININCVDKMTE